MATGKRYYWMKLKDTFMSSETVDYFMSLPNGSNYVVLYQMLCLLTINTDGRLERKIGDLVIPFDIPKIQRDTKWFSEDTIRVALSLYQNAGLLYQDENGVLVLVDHRNLVGSETDYARQKKTQRISRSEKAELPAADRPEDTRTDTPVDNSVDNPVDNPVDNGVDNVHTEIRDKRLRDIDIRDIENRDKSNDNTEEVDTMISAVLPDQPPSGAQTEPKKRTVRKAEKESAVYQIPLADGTMHDVTESDLRQYRVLYPGVDVDQEIRNIIGWNVANPRRRKTKSGIRSHITTWLARQQNRGCGWKRNEQKDGGANPYAYTYDDQLPY